MPALPTIGGKSFYKQIDGVKLDGAALRSAKRAQAGERDGRISKKDATRIAKKLTDGNAYTKAERATAAMIRKLGNLTGAGARELDHQIRSAGQKR